MPKPLKSDVSGVIYQASASFTIANALDSNATVQIDLGYSIRDLVVMRIKKVEYHLLSGNTIGNAFGANADSVKFGLTQDPSAAVTAPVPESLGMLDYNMLCRRDIGTPAISYIDRDPFIEKNKMDVWKDGMLAHPASLYYWYYVTNAMAQDLSVHAVIFYDIQEVDANTYQQLINNLLINR